MIWSIYEVIVIKLFCVRWDYQEGVVAVASYQVILKEDLHSSQMSDSLQGSVMQLI